MRGGADYVIKRAIFALVTVFVAITLNFVLFRAAPGTAIANVARVPGASPELRAELKREFGLDKSKWEQYVIYLGQLSRGNLGISFATREPVRSELAKALVNTIPMVALGEIFAIVVGTAVGVIAAWRRGTAVDKGGVSIALAFYSMPTQWLGLMMILLFAGILPTAGRETAFYLVAPTPWQHIVDVLKHMILPSMTLGLVLFGEYTLVARSAMLETLGEDYILTARAKGLRDRRIVRRHAFRNALLPITTMVAISLGYIVAGSILAESVFSWPGIGKLMFDSIGERDYPMLQGVFLVLTVSVVLANFVADLLYFKLDPRIRE
jgi:ABC-type dipeptide/oligopeptide/nickel transport system permease component